MASTPSVLAESVGLRGRIRGDGDLEIRGRVEGEVDVTGDLIVAGSAMIKASLRGGRVVVRGPVLGDVDGSESIVLEESARVIGNLSAPRIAIALGAQIRGELKMDLGAGDIERPRAARSTTTTTTTARRAAPPPAARPAPARA